MEHSVEVIHALELEELQGIDVIVEITLLVNVCLLNAFYLFIFLEMRMSVICKVIEWVGWRGGGLSGSVFIVI